MEACSALSISVLGAHETCLGALCPHSVLRGLLADIPLWTKSNRPAKAAGCGSGPRSVLPRRWVLWLQRARAAWGCSTGSAD